MLDGLQHVVQAVDIEKGLLLSGKGGIRQVFRRRARTHGERVRA
jgi:hypothetical protein